MCTKTHCNCGSDTSDDEDVTMKRVENKQPLGLSLMYYVAPLVLVRRHQLMEKAMGRARYLQVANFELFKPLGSLKSSNTNTNNTFIWTWYSATEPDTLEVICDQYLHIISPTNIYSTLQHSICR